MTKLPLGFGNLDFGDWIRGLIAAVVSGGSSAVTSTFAVSMIVPGKLNVGQFFELAGSVFAISGALAFFGYLRTNPVPDVKQVVSTVEVTQAGTKPPVVVTTRQETSIEPLEPAKDEKAL